MAGCDMILTKCGVMENTLYSTYIGQLAGSETSCETIFQHLPTVKSPVTRFLDATGNILQKNQTGSRTARNLIRILPLDPSTRSRKRKAQNGVVSSGFTMLLPCKPCNVGKNNATKPPPFITIVIGAMVTISSHGWSVTHFFNHTK